jgi:hypothetical protein
MEIEWGKDKATPETVSAVEHSVAFEWCGIELIGQSKRYMCKRLFNQLVKKESVMRDEEKGESD